jgi:hypothetical protein
MSTNKNLNNAKDTKNDEFYTPLSTIKEEIDAYYEYDKNVFKDKVVYLNCDNPYESNFFKYFILNFNRFGLKQLIATNYSGDKLAGTLNPLFDEPDETNKKNIAHKVIINEVTGNNYDLNSLLNNPKNIYGTLKGDDAYPAGDFRSKECIELLQKSDIIVTNPPFSLFREYVDLIIKHNKKFIVLGHHIAISYKNIFIYFMKNQLWVGKNYAVRVSFYTPNNKEKAIAITWYTNLLRFKQPKKIKLKSIEENLIYKEKYPDLYKEYDNFYAIEVPRIKLIPNDYNGIIGVPLTFIYFYNQNQFEIISLERYVDDFGYSFLKKPEKIYNQCEINGKNVFRRIFIKLKK